MKNKKIIMSAVLLTLLSTGCVKPTEEVNTAQNDNSNGETVVYTEQPNGVTYEESAPIVYGDPTATTTPNNNVIYGTPTGTGDGTIIATDHYQPAVGTTSTGSGAYGAYGTTSTGSGAYGAYGTTSTGSGAYGAYGTPTGGGEIYNSVDDPYTTTGANSSYSTNNSYSNNSYTTNSGYSGGGIQLQVAALSDYYAAQEFKNGLSLDPKYSAYVKKGRMNKVIIKGFSSRAEAKALAARQFPGAFIVSGSSSYSSTPSYSGGSSSYSTNTSYSTSHVNTNSGIGIQVGAFSSKTKARSVAQSKAGGKYTAIVKTATIRGRTIYKAIILGFSSRADAKRAIASGRFGDAFVVSIH